MNYPQFAEVDGKRYKINTDFRVAIECNEIGFDESIGDYERALAIIYKIFGDEGLSDNENHEKLLELATKFLSCGKELDKEQKGEIDMDFVEDMDYIEASFMSDYNIDLANVEMHWWKFYNLINGLSNSEMGNCCVLNRIRNLRTYDTKDIKDPKQLEKIKEAQRQVALKPKNKKIKVTSEQQKNIDNFYDKLGIKRKE